MLTTLAHLGHSHTNVNTGVASDLDHCMPIIVGAGIVIVILFLIILYFLMAWQPKAQSKTTTKTKGKVVKTSAPKKPRR